MAFVPDFENDIFISYSHTDNVPVIEGHPGWVDFFEDVLRKRIRVRLRVPEAEDVKIFRDAQLRRFGKFSEQINYELPNSAVFLCVLSPGFVGSKWCSRELRDFCGAGVDRIIKVVKTGFDAPEPETEIGRLLSQIAEVLECRFYTKNESSDLVSDLQPEVVEAHVPEFLVKIDEVAQHLANLLKHLRARRLTTNGRASPVGPVIVTHEKLAVYVAETTKDLASKREEIKTELSQFNCQVLPDQPLPQDGEQLVARVKEYLERTKLSVHLLGSTYGLVPESEERSVPQIQYELAAERNKTSQLGQLIWIPDGLVTIDPRQQSLISLVKNNAPDVLQSKFEDLKTEIHKKLKPPSNPVWGDDAANSINISLFCHDQDITSVAPLYSYLTMQELFRVKLPLRETQSVEEQKEVTQTSDAVLLYYGTASVEWFMNIWRLIQRQISAPGGKSILARAIYAAKPPTIEKNLLEAEDPIIIKNYEGFTPATLLPFITRIKAARGGLQ
jgi:hypothetical protein